MPNRSQEYPEYEEALRKQEIDATLDTAHMLDKILVAGEMRKFLYLTEDEQKEKQ